MDLLERFLDKNINIMNILFISLDADPPNMGGAATVINIIAKYFLDKGHRIFLGYIVKSKTPSSFFKEKIFIHKSNKIEVEKFFIQNKIDIIYNICGQDIDWNFYRQFKGNAKEIVAIHGRPQTRIWELETVWNFFKEAKNPIKKIHKLLWIASLPITNYVRNWREKRYFIDLYRYSDKVMFLSMKYLPLFEKITNKYPIDLNKFTAIPNPLVFNEKFSISDYDLKEKRVLVVSSICALKRIDLILKIWSKIEQDEKYNEWRFDLVGDGAALDKYKLLSKKLGIKRITFYGKQNPISYYRRSSIFLMTSRTEGWPMVLMESMQMGVIPIVYNSFEALEEIIEDGKNGFIIENNNEKQFIDKLKSLLENKSLRKEIANNAILSSSRFDIDIIGKKYEELFLTLCKH